MRVLISGASIAGPVLAYWLARYGYRPTVVERAPALRKAGGHAVDLFRPAVDIVERMGVLPAVRDRRTGTERLTMLVDGGRKRAHVDLDRVFTSDRHVEIMRDDLSEIFYDATRDDVEYLFGDSIATLEQDADGVEVTFEHAPPRRFDLVIGADGLHSNVRRLVFGEERRFSAFIGAYLAVATVPNHLDLSDHVMMAVAPGRMAACYSARSMDDARALFLFRSDHELDYHHRDVPRQKELLRAAFAGMGWEVPRLLDELDRTPAFYFDSITQLRMDTWSRGRVSLVGDAGYSPGPAVGGSTSMAVIGAYVLAGELAAAGGDHERAFRAYEREMAGYVRRAREVAMGAAKWLVPGTRFQTWASFRGTWLMGKLPKRVTGALNTVTSKAVRVHDTVPVKDYPSMSGIARSGVRPPR
ncbi:FAD-dependent monooxygenase [Thermostaphylospora chromogena]|uniref:2-polyprenyl-6-methoxyphenol hydroxylase n=1 Tax=Thermostaphylospora chromogena TaxID=35622 RepID=A0A1H1CT20_9ACTN|nr:FAD-dependent monooxygenase [Thermostaphylospora chromogena]SDQ67405.1 2-polyprenyl-6-methoxyphenol hydroxylase [Thermostaphylospora chromogena]